MLNKLDIGKLAPSGAQNVALIKAPLQYQKVAITYELAGDHEDSKIGAGTDSDWLLAGRPGFAVDEEVVGPESSAERMVAEAVLRNRNGARERLRIASFHQHSEWSFGKALSLNDWLAEDTNTTGYKAVLVMQAQHANEHIDFLALKCLAVLGRCRQYGYTTEVRVVLNRKITVGLESPMPLNGCSSPIPVVRLKAHDGAAPFERFRLVQIPGDEIWIDGNRFTEATVKQAMNYLHGNAPGVSEETIPELRRRIIDALAIEKATELVEAANGWFVRPGATFLVWSEEAKNWAVDLTTDWDVVGPFDNVVTDGQVQGPSCLSSDWDEADRSEWDDGIREALMQERRNS